MLIAGCSHGQRWSKILRRTPPLTLSIFPLSPVHYIPFEIFRFSPSFCRNDTSRSRVPLRVQFIAETIIELWRTIARKVTTRSGRKTCARFFILFCGFCRAINCDVSKTRAMRSLGVTNPDGTHEMNGSTNGSPSADDGVTLRKGV